MNILLWLVQVVLALLYVAGGAYKTFAFDEVATHFEAVPRGLWSAVGVVEMVGGVLLLVPSAFNWKPMLTPIAAAVLTVETLGLAALYGSYSLELVSTNPLPWSVVMAALAAFVAFGRRRVPS